jgi:hypothetical protein
MNRHDDEAWLDSLLQRRLPSGLSDDGFQQRVLQRLPQRERRVRRWLTLSVTWAVAAAVPLLSSDVGVLSAPGTVHLAVPFSLGTALLWYLADSLT